MTITEPVDHEHQWGPVELAHFTGNPHRKCQVCWWVTLDLHDDELTDWTVSFAVRNSRGIAWISEVTVWADEDTVEYAATEEINAEYGVDGKPCTIILVDYTRHPPKKES